MKKLSNVHPGEILRYEFLEPLEITAYKLSKNLNIPQNNHWTNAWQEECQIF